MLGIVAGVLLIDHEVRKTDFQQVPYHRIFIMLFLELNSPDPILENINYQVSYQLLLLFVNIVCLNGGRCGVSVVVLRHFQR